MHVIFTPRKRERAKGTAATAANAPTAVNRFVLSNVTVLCQKFYRPPYVETGREGAVHKAISETIFDPSLPIISRGKPDESAKKKKKLIEIQTFFANHLKIPSSNI